MNSVLLPLIFFIILSRGECLVESPENEAAVIDECLNRFGGLTVDNSQRLQRYKEWSESYEEIPCFTNCYLSKAFNFYNESEGFDTELVIEKFGKALHNVCKDKLNQGTTACERAYQGFHCLTRHEDDPFIYIDAMEAVHSDAKEAMKECLYQFDPFEWNRLKEYSKFPVREPIPCYTKCFIDKLSLFNKRSRQWDMEKMRSMLGVPPANSNTAACDLLNKRRHRNICVWLYQIFTCYAFAN